MMLLCKYSAAVCCGRCLTLRMNVPCQLKRICIPDNMLLHWYAESRLDMWKCRAVSDLGSHERAQVCSKYKIHLKMPKSYIRIGDRISCCNLHTKFSTSMPSLCPLYCMQFRHMANL